MVGDELHGCTISSLGDQALQDAWQALARAQPDSVAAWQTLLGTRGLEGPDARVLQDQWQLLQGIRLLRSGSTPSQVVSRLGYRDESALAEAHLHWLGAPLSPQPSATR